MAKSFPKKISKSKVAPVKVAPAKVSAKTPAPVKRVGSPLIKPSKTRTNSHTAQPVTVVASAKPVKSMKASKRIDGNGSGAIRFPGNLPIPPAPVPTNGKPRKNQAGLSSKELEHYRELLLAKRRELVGDMSAMEREALRSTTATSLSNLPLHMADMGTDNYEQEFTLVLVEKDRQLLREINQGLAKIQDGTYGLCEATGKPINKPRLEAQPWARFSIEHARKMERGGVGVRRL